MSIDCSNTNGTSITAQSLGVNVEKGEAVRARGQGGPQDGNSGSGKNRAAELLNSQQLWLHT